MHRWQFILKIAFCQFSNAIGRVGKGPHAYGPAQNAIHPSRRITSQRMMRNVGNVDWRSLFSHLSRLRDVIRCYFIIVDRTDRYFIGQVVWVSKIIAKMLCIFCLKYILVY